MGILVQAVQGDDEGTEEECRKEQSPLPRMADKQEDAKVEYEVLQNRENIESRPQKKVRRADERQKSHQGKAGSRQG